MTDITEQARVVSEEISNFLFDDYPDNEMNRGQATNHIAGIIMRHVHSPTLTEAQAYKEVRDLVYRIAPNGEADAALMLAINNLVASVQSPSVTEPKNLVDEIDELLSEAIGYDYTRANCVICNRVKENEDAE